MKSIRELIYLELLEKMKKPGFYVMLLLPIALGTLISVATISTGANSIPIEFWTKGFHMLGQFYIVPSFYVVFYASWIISKDLQSGMHKFLFQRVTRGQIFSARYITVVLIMLILSIEMFIYLIIMGIITPELFSYTLKDVLYVFGEWMFLSMASAAVVILYSVFFNRRSTVIIILTSFLAFNIIVMSILRSVVMITKDLSSILHSILKIMIMLYDYSPFSIPFDTMLSANNRKPEIVFGLYFIYLIASLGLGFYIYNRKEYK